MPVGTARVAHPDRRARVVDEVAAVVRIGRLRLRQGSAGQAPGEAVRRRRVVLGTRASRIEAAERQETLAAEGDQGRVLGECVPVGQHRRGRGRDATGSVEDGGVVGVRARRHVLSPDHLDRRPEPGERGLVDVADLGIRSGRRGLGELRPVARSSEGRRSGPDDEGQREGPDRRRLRDARCSTSIHDAPLSSSPLVTIVEGRDSWACVAPIDRFTPHRGRSAGWPPRSVRSRRPGTGWRRPGGRRRVRPRGP